MPVSMAQNAASKQVIRYDKLMPEGGRGWHCGDCGSAIEGREGYDRHIACFPLHHPQPDVVQETNSPKP